MSLYWFLWLALGFGVPETVALIRHRTQDTLSGTVWNWCSVTPGSTIAHWTFLHVALAAAMIWLTVHFVFGIWRG